MADQEVVKKAAKKATAPKKAPAMAKAAAPKKAPAPKKEPVVKEPTARKTAAKKVTAAAQPAVNPDLRAMMIAEAAYYRAEQRGFHPGNDIDDWLAAEQEIDEQLPRA